GPRPGRLGPRRLRPRLRLHAALGWLRRPRFQQPPRGLRVALVTRAQQQLKGRGQPAFAHRRRHARPGPVRPASRAGSAPGYRQPAPPSGHPRRRAPTVCRPRAGAGAARLLCAGRAPEPGPRAHCVLGARRSRDRAPPVPAFGGPGNLRGAPAPGPRVPFCFFGVSSPHCPGAPETSCQGKEHLKERLANELSGLPKVRLIRASKREGLVRARLLGASVARGDVLTFLDCHCECHEGWLEPLLQRIHEEESAVVCPVIDVIDWNTFEYLGNSGEPQIGGFNWRLVFTWHTVPERERIQMRSPVDVIRSPTMAGGLFAVSKKYFEYLGSYDTGMEVWGGENLEFSFRIWQCGGTLETHPCSHVGHVFPKQAPYSRNKALANSVRAAEVWMDEFKELYYHRNPRARLEPFGDVTERKQLRAKLQCKDFKWFLETVYPELHVPEDRPGFFGMLQNKGLKDYCFDYNPPDENQIVGHQVILYLCHGMGQNQFFEYTSQKEIRYNTHQPEGCIAVEAGMDVLTMHLCKETTPENQKFILQEDGSLFHEQSQKCVQAERKESSDSFVPLLRDCTSSDNQKWFFKERMF
uniref:Polypeptide N-acetylgalactosaminyltransferase n=1 Tax=Callithrix jacchus TaxID=9483 RepID=A0A8I3WB38_CALJA